MSRSDIEREHYSHICLKKKVCFPPFRWLADNHFHHSNYNFHQKFFYHLLSKHAEQVSIL